MAILTSGVTAGFATNTAAAPATSGVACVVDQNPAGGFLPHNYEMANYTVVDGTHLRLTLNKVHAAQSTVAIGGLCGYGIEQTVDTVAGIRQLFPVVGSCSSTALYYAGGQTAIVGITGQTGGFLNLSATVASIARSANLVTLTATGRFPQDINGLSMTIGGVTDSSYNGTFVVTTTSANTLTYAQAGPDSTSTNGTASILTGGYALYPMAEVLGVMNPATRQVDGQFTLAPNTIAFAANDALEEPHYYQERIAPDSELISQTVPRATGIQYGGISYQGTNATGLIGWRISNDSPALSYLGAGGNHTAPFDALVTTGVWQQTMELDAGLSTVFQIHCNYHGCNRWNSGYNLFLLNSAVGVDLVAYEPQDSTININLRGTGYQFTPQAFSATTINAGTINATTINGPVSGNSITSGAVAAAYLPLLGASGAAHAAGLVPDPGIVTGSSRYLREDGTWSVPGGQNVGGGNLLAGATADYNFLQGTGTSVLDTSGSGNNGTFVSGQAPSWTTTGLAFLPGQGVSLPAALDGTQTYFLGLYINPISAGAQIANQYPILMSSSTGGNGFNFMYDYSPNTQNGFIPNAYAPTFFVNGHTTTVTPNLISGFHVLAAVLGTAGNSTPDRIYIDGVEVASYTGQGSSAGVQTSGNLFLGSSGVNPWTASGFLGTMYRMRTYATPLTPAAVLSISASITNEVAGRGVPVVPVNIQLAAPQLQAIGDSITFGLGVSTPWPSLLTLTNQPAYTITDWGISGIELTAINGSEPNRAALRCHTSAGPSIAVIFAGTNDFALVATAPTAVLMSLLGEVQTMKQAGCKVFVGTMLSRGGNDVGGTLYDANKDAYDALILSQAKAGGADGIIDFAANPLLGADGANQGSYFQSDNIHPNQAGQQLLANAASNVLNYTFGANETSPHVVTTLGYSMTAGDGYISLAGLTGAGTLTLPDCTGQSGASYRINNPQAAFAVAVVPFNTSQLVNGLGSATVPANATLTMRDTPNPKAVSGCHWEM
ncbi:GDSL-type esterase/lipase family protein [Granulicella arctica]|uniref:GDSL-type esterase/lipase family protein n=1 Tax=Granulicella arctica TaxID=940613 RepID=UPI0021DFAF16|nr:GDSL-type esterase/lipase family protein [Granulicella arctica]